MEFHRIWVEQCAAVENVRSPLRHGQSTWLSRRRETAVKQ